MMPPAHALGALLLEQERVAEAHVVYVRVSEQYAMTFVTTLIFHVDCRTYNDTLRIFGHYSACKNAYYGKSRQMRVSKLKLYLLCWTRPRSHVTPPSNLLAFVACLHTTVNPSGSELCV